MQAWAEAACWAIAMDTAPWVECIAGFVAAGVMVGSAFVVPALAAVAVFVADGAVGCSALGRLAAFAAASPLDALLARAAPSSLFPSLRTLAAFSLLACSGELCSATRCVSGTFLGGTVLRMVTCGGSGARGSVELASGFAANGRALSAASIMYMGGGAHVARKGIVPSERRWLAP